MAENLTADTLWRTLYALKETPRQGWLDRGIPAANAESVADHSHFTALIAWTIACDDDSLDANKVLQLATIHDVAEALVGDLPPYEAHEIPDRQDIEAMNAFFGVRRERSAENAARKRTAETAATERILGMLSGAAQSGWRALLEEYEAQQTPEARLVKQVDRLEVFIQSRLYAERFPEAPLAGFTDMALKTITHPALVAIRDAFLTKD